MQNNTRFQRHLGAAALSLALIVGAAGCSTSGTVEAEQTTEALVGIDVDLTSGTDTDQLALFDSSVVHEIEIEFDTDDYDQVIETYATTGEKDWIEATITIDGTTIENIGLRLKGNSSLFGLTLDTAENPEELPWLIRFDKFVDEQTYQGYGDLVIRSNSTETAMNEAVALELLGVAGLATEEAIATTFTVNDGGTEVRLAIEHPDEVWEDAAFDSDEAALYKADSTGDYSYRGDDPEAYTDIFNQKVGDDDLEPLIEFLEFINNSDDATFATELANRLDVDAFATYLAFQDLVGNADDIDGRGNNSYLHYDYETQQFTVVSWDLNLAFDTANVNGGGPGAAGGRGAGGPGAVGGPGAAGGPGAVGGPGAAGGGPGAGGSNVLAERFMANDDFAQLYTTATVELTETLFSSGTADAIISTWTTVLTEQASELIDVATIEADAAAIRSSIGNS